MTFTDIVFSIITGVAASYGVWWYTFKFLTPKITFASCVSKIASDENPSTYRYRFKFENSGNRNIIDAEVIVRVRIKGLRPKQKDNWEVIYVSTSSLEYKKLAIVRPVNRSASEFSPLRPVLEIKAYDCEYFTREMFDAETKKLAKEKKLTLDHILKLGEEANMQILILAYDEFSGSRKFFESPVMGLQNIKSGYYDKNSVNMANQTHSAGTVRSGLQQFKRYHYLTIIAGLLIFTSWIAQNKMTSHYSNEIDDLKRSQLAVDIAESDRSMFELQLVHGDNKENVDSLHLVYVEKNLAFIYMNLLTWSKSRINDDKSADSTLYHKKYDMIEYLNIAYINKNYAGIDQQFKLIVLDFQKYYMDLDKQFIIKSQEVRENQETWNNIFMGSYVIGSVLLAFVYISKVRKGIIE